MPPPGNVRRPPIDPMLTMRPALARRMPGSTSWVRRSRPKTLVSNCLRTSSIGTSSTGPDWLYAALFTSASMWPCYRSTAATAARIDASLVTSSESRSAPACTSDSSVSGRRAVAYTVQPAAVIRSAIAAPMPEEQPVMRTVGTIGSYRLRTSDYGVRAGLKACATGDDSTPEPWNPGTLEPCTCYTPPDSRRPRVKRRDLLTTMGASSLFGLSGGVPARAAEARSFSGLTSGVGDLHRLSRARTRSISPENFTGAKGGGGQATEGTGARASRDLGKGWKVSPSVGIKAGETFTLADISGPGAIQHIWMTPTGHWRFQILRIYWDGEATPSVEVPVGDFFPSGWGKHGQISSLAVAVNPGSAFNSYWTMPFRKSCRMTITNVGTK